METLERLITARNPNKSIRELTERAGIPHNRLAYYLKPGSKIERMPSAETIEVIARAINATPHEVFLAFGQDLGYPV